MSCVSGDSIGAGVERQDKGSIVPLLHAETKNSIYQCIIASMQWRGLKAKTNAFAFSHSPSHPTQDPAYPTQHHSISPAHDKDVSSYLIGTLSAPCEDVWAGVSVESLWQTPHQTLLNEVTLLDIHSGESAVEHASLLIGE